MFCNRNSQKLKLNCLFFNKFEPEPTLYIELSQHTFFDNLNNSRPHSVSIADFMVLLSNQLQLKTVALILHATIAMLGKHNLQYSKIVLISSLISQNSISMHNLSTLLQIMIENKAYYLKTKLGCMKFRGLSRSKIFELEKNFEKIVSENLRAASETDEFRGTPKLPLCVDMLRASSLFLIQKKLYHRCRYIQIGNSHSITSIFVSPCSRHSTRHANCSGKCRSSCFQSKA